MKKILIGFLFITSLFLYGCDSNENDNVTVESDDGFYLNTSESVSVNAYNKYRLIESIRENSEDGSITVTLKFNKVLIK